MDADMSHHNRHEHLHKNTDPLVEVPEAVDSERSPQLDKVKSRNRCGCACASSRDNSENGNDGGGGGGAASAEEVVMLPSAAISENDCTFDDNVSVRGDEGIEEHSIGVDNHGMVRLRDIFVALARHSPCTCHGATNESGGPTGMMASPSDSMMAQANSDSGMRQSSMSPLSSRSLLTRTTSTSALVAHMGSGFTDAPDFQLPLPALHNFIGDPIWLTQEREHSSNMIIGGLHYPMELSMTDDHTGSVFSDYDMW